MSAYTVNDGNSGNNYTVTTHSAVGTITPAALAINAVTDTKIYDGTTSSDEIPSAIGLKVGDSVTGLVQAFQSKNVMGLDGSTLVVIAYMVNDGNDGDNYTITTNTAAGTITPAALDINAVTDTKVYDGTTSSDETPTVSGLQGTDTVTGLSQVFASKNVFDVDLSLLEVSAGYTVNDDNGGANYTVTLHSAEGTITPADLDIKAVTDSKVYDGTTSSDETPTVSGLQGTDTVTGKAQAFQSKNVLGSGLSTIEVTAYTVNDDNGGDNYTVVLHTAAGTITPADLDINAVTDSKTYDGTTTQAVSRPSPACRARHRTGRVQAFASKNVLGTNGSTLNVTAYTVNDDNGGDNYTVTLHTAAGTITPADLDINAVTDSKTYDGTSTSSGVPTVTGLQGTDTVTGRVQAFASKNVLGTNGSTLNVTAYTVNDDNGGGNYTVTLHTAAGTISPAALTITAVTDAKVYDGTTSSDETPTVTGLLGTDTVTDRAQAYGSKNVLGAGLSTLQVTSYTVSDDNGGDNYTVTTNTATGTISARPLTITATNNLTKVFDGTTASVVAPDITAGAIQIGDTANFSQTFSSAGVGTGKTVTPSGAVIDGNGGANYSYTFVVRTNGSITARPITVTATAGSKVYDGTTSSAGIPTITSGSLATGDTATFSQTYDSKNVGTNRVLTPAISFTSGSAANYAITLATQINQAITPAGLDISAVTDSKTYDTTTSSTGVPTVSGLKPGDSVTGKAQAFVSPNVMGVGGSTLVVTAYTVVDGNSGNNYTVTLHTATGTISRATLTVTAVNKSKVLNAVNPTLTVIYTGFLGTDTLASSVTGAPSITTTATTTSPVGTYPIIVTQGTLASTNYTFTFVNGTLTIGYQFTGFGPPIDNGVVNKATAGQAIPIKWRLTDANGVGISDPASFVSVTSNTTGCGSGLPTDEIETYAGSSGLLYQGNGNWQFNWKTPKAYTGQCRTMHLNLSDVIAPATTPVDRTAMFQFK